MLRFATPHQGASTSAFGSSKDSTLLLASMAQLFPLMSVSAVSI
jgi:hypothetical protein